MRGRRRVEPAILASFALLLGALLGLQLAGPEPGLLYLTPALALIAALLLGHYPGERLLLAAARPRRRRASSAAPSFRSAPAGRRLPRGGSLLATGLAGRAPPSHHAPCACGA